MPKHVIRSAPQTEGARPLRSQGAESPAFNAHKQILAALVVALYVVGCAGPGIDDSPLVENDKGQWERASRVKHTGLFGGDGINLLPSASKGEGRGIGVNTFLWRAALDVASFTPLLSADPFGGVIITDWRSPQDKTTERYKLTIYIMGRQLLSNAVKVSVFKQVRSAAGAWKDAPVAASVAAAFENEILTRARKLRVAAGQQQ